MLVQQKSERQRTPALVSRAYVFSKQSSCSNKGWQASIEKIILPVINFIERRLL